MRIRTGVQTCALPIFADVVLHPAFAPKDFDRLKEQILAGIAAAKQDPNGEAGRILPTLLFGDDSAHGQLTTAAAEQSIDRKDVERFNSRRIQPNNGKLE